MMEKHERMVSLEGLAGRLIPVIRLTRELIESAMPLLDISPAPDGLEDPSQELLCSIKADMEEGGAKLAYSRLLQTIGDEFLPDGAGPGGLPHFLNPNVYRSLIDALDDLEHYLSSGLDKEKTED
jgi:hypothetical protein